MSSTRFFLADLPSSATENDLKSLFQDYGSVQRVELKSREQFVDADQTSTKIIAFVTVNTQDPDYCLNELNWQKLHGYKLKVSIAKESFLDRLKREREEEQAQQEKHGAVDSFKESNSELLTQSTQNKRRVFGEHEELNDDDIAPELLMTKKRAANTLYNGKIVIQHDPEITPLHIIEQQKKPAKHQLDAKSAIADSKRKESLNKMKQQYNQKISAIKDALSFTNAAQSKRIKFSDAESEEEQEKPDSSADKKKKALFNEDSEGEFEDEAEFVLPQHEGKKGERLLQMQSKQSLDPRFRITSGFVEEEDDEEQQDDADESAQQENERDWQMGILEQVVGKQIDSSNAKTDKSAKNKKMLRFDPAKQEHQKLLRQKAAPSDKVNTKPDAAPETKKAQNNNANVSKTAFYVVTDTLKQSLNMRGEGFSLLDMFGSTHDEATAERQNLLQKVSNEKIMLNKSNNVLGIDNLNPFSYDSSESEDEVVANEQQQQQPAKENEEPKKALTKQRSKKAKQYSESFFIPKNDARLKEGAKFFKFKKTDGENENYEHVRNRLKMLISTKIAKTMKKLPGGGIVKKRKNKKRN